MLSSVTSDEPNASASIYQLSVLPVCIHDWTALEDSFVEVRKGDRVICAGVVDSVTADGTILWIQPPSDQRRLYEKSASYTVWVYATLPTTTGMRALPS